MEWSIGEICTETFKMPNLILTQGLHQGEYLFYGVKENINNLSINIYPNPTSDFISIVLDNYKETITAKMYDIIGNKIYEAEFIKEQKIDMSNFVDGLYIIEISNKDLTLSRTYKIEKINN